MLQPDRPTPNSAGRRQVMRVVLDLPEEEIDPTPEQAEAF
jgi:hypothetical protein